MLDYSWLIRLIPLAAYLLLLVAAIGFVRATSNSARYLLFVPMLGLMAVLVYFNGLVSGAGWIAEGALYFLGCTLIGLGCGYGMAFLRQGRGWLALAPLSLAAVAAVWGAMSAGGPSGIASPYNGWGFSALPPLIGGFVLAHSLAHGQARTTRYVTLWLLFAGTIGIGAYMNHMEGITYALVAPERMFGPYAEARVTEAVLASVMATIIYVAGSLLLLLPPAFSKRSSGLDARTRVC